LQSAFHVLEPVVASNPDSMILELHGSLRYVVCLHCRQRSLRTKIQSELERLNPRWCRLLKLDEQDIKINADGDVDLSASALGTDEIYEYNTFRYPPCPVCLSRYGDGEVLQLDSDGAWRGGSVGIIKPAVIFFGENVSSETRLLVNQLIESCDQILVVGTTLAVLSAQRLVRTAKSQGKRVAVITSGYVRGEESLLQENDVRIWWRSSEVFKHLSHVSGLQGDPIAYT
jgi:NAD+-dependent protein deacetylase sirtuin 4